MREAQEAMHRINVAGVPVAILTLTIRAVITRWTAHFLAFKRLLDLKWVLDHLIRNDELLPPKDRRLTVGDSKARKKAKQMIALIKNSEFWHSIATINKHLEPLARASCILQATHARLDQVPIVFGTLIKEFQQMIGGARSQVQSVF